MLEELKERGFYQQSTHPEEMAKRLEKDRVCCYVGFDPTADSMHVGHLIPFKLDDCTNKLAIFSPK